MNDNYACTHTHTHILYCEHAENSIVFFLDLAVVVLPLLYSFSFCLFFLTLFLSCYVIMKCITVFLLIRYTMTSSSS